VSTNPYQPPETQSPRPRRDRLPAARTLEILRAERGLVRLLLLNLGVDFLLLSGLAATIGPRYGERVWLLVVFCMSVALSYYVFRGAKAAYGIGYALLFSLATLIPCIGLLIGLMLTADLRDVLRQSNAEVGLLGATRDQLNVWQTKAHAEALSKEE